MANKTVVAAGGLVQNDFGEILIMFRRGVWDMPKGKLDKGESIEQCAVREVEEETGLQNIELGNFIHKTYHQYWDKWTKKELEKETHWYAMHAKGAQTLVPQAEEDITEIVWVKPEDIVNYENNMHKNIVEVIRIFFGKNKL